ncbi:hypothetical protein GXW82_43770 [Streptacidiphilus sp. 4-A2]|nr:hypothetical protein [Streptacidiphilus sp. 4-A2]
MTTEHDASRPANDQPLVWTPVQALPPTRAQRLRSALATWTGQRLLPALARCGRAGRSRADALAAWAGEHLTPALVRRRQELEEALTDGWDSARTWIKILATLIGLMVLVYAGNLLADLLASLYHRLVGHHTGLLTTITTPVQNWTAAHSGSLPISAGSLFGLWELAGLVLLITSFAGSAAARLAWTGYGAATAAMVWSATPAPDQAAATGIAALTWALASIIALHGLSLRPVITNITHVTSGLPQLTARETRARDTEDVW